MFLNGQLFTTREGFCVSETPSVFTPASGAVAFWDFNNAASLTLVSTAISSVTDPVGGQAMAQASGGSQPVYSATGGYNNRGYATFNGSFLSTASFAYVSGSTFSIAARVYGSAQQNKIILGYSSSAVNPYFNLASGNSDQTKLRGNVSDTSDATALESSATAFDSTWHTIVMTFDGPTSGTESLYVDSNSPTQVTGTLVSLGTSNGMLMGARNIGAPENFFAGKIEYVAVYNRVLTQANVTKLVAYGS